MLKLPSHLTRLARLSTLFHQFRRFGASCLICLPWAKPRPAPVSRRASERPGEDLAEQERILGCGWFDSSYELGQGLAVTVADDQALSALPLATWLDLELWSCRTFAHSA